MHTDVKLSYRGWLKAPGTLHYNGVESGGDDRTEQGTEHFARRCGRESSA